MYNNKIKIVKLYPLSKPILMITLMALSFFVMFSNHLTASTAEEKSILLIDNSNASIVGDDRLKYSYVKKGAYKNSSYCLMFHYDNSKDKRAWGRIDLAQTTGFTKFNALVFYIKGEIGDEKFKIYLKSGVGDKRSQQPSKENRPEINKFLPDGISTEWKEVIIPVKDISKGINSASISYIMFQAEPELGPFKIYIDDISLQIRQIKQVEQVEQIKSPPPIKRKEYHAKFIQNEKTSLAKQIIEKTGIKGGMIVHIGCKDGKLTFALRINNNYVVHGLDPDPKNISFARSYINSQSLQNSVSVVHYNLKKGKLPYINNLVNLIVSEDINNISKNEILRVLCPNGVAYIKKGEKWEMIKKPYPKDIGDWTHLMGSSSGNAVAQDKQIAQPKHLQWKAGREWDRQHDWIKSLTCMVSARGRIFYNIDDATSADMYVPPKWSIVSRDAFNGTLLWKRPLEEWTKWGQRNKYNPMALHRSIVADPKKDVVYLWLFNNAPVSALDAATGRTIQTYKTTAGAEEIIVYQNILYVVTGSLNGQPMSMLAFHYNDLLKSGFFPNTKTIHAVDSSTGKELWKWVDSKEAPYFPGTLSANGDGVYLHAGNTVYKFHYKSGKIKWKAETGWIIPLNKDYKPNKTDPRIAGLIVAEKGVVLDVSQADNTLRAFNDTDGKLLWSHSGINGNIKEPAELFVINNTVWVKDKTEYQAGLDLRTGKPSAKTPGINAIESQGHHDRCYRGKATLNYILGRHRGLELIDISGGSKHSRNNWARGTCRYGVMPANGLIYIPPHSCACYMESKIVGLHALAPERKNVSTSPVPDKERLVKGPAYGKISFSPTLVKTQQEKEWPFLRQNILRSGVTSVSPPKKINRDIWKKNPGGNPTAPVVANGMVFVSLIDKRKVVALDASTGKTVWEYSIGGRVDSPPTVYSGLILFGARDGWIYCVRASDGTLVWKFLGALKNLNTLENNLVESLWPIPGNILVHKGTAYFAAGRNAYLDNGIYLWALDPFTGKIKASNNIKIKHEQWDDEIKHKNKYETIPFLKNNFTTYKTIFGNDRSDAFAMEGARNDVLVSDGNSIFMRHIRFDTDLKRVKKRATHLYATSSLLDREGNHRAAWILGSGDMREVQSPNHAWTVDRVDVEPAHTSSGNRFLPPTGRIMTYDDKYAYAIQQIGGNRPYFSDFWVSSRSYPGLNTGKDPGKDLAKEETSQPIKRKWVKKVSDLYPVSIIKAGDYLIVSGNPTKISSFDPWASYEGRNHGYIWYLSSSDGEIIYKKKIESPPVWDGVAVANKKIYMTTMDGSIRCMGE